MIEEIEDIFFVCANTSLSENPEVFHEMYGEFSKLIDDRKYYGYNERVTKIIDYFISFVKTDDLETTNRILKEESQNLIIERFEKSSFLFS